MGKTIELDTIEYKGNEYPCRDVYIDEESGTVNISVDSLSKALNPNDNWDEVEEEAEYIDSKIFFYVPDEMINNPIKELRDYIKESI